MGAGTQTPPPSAASLLPTDIMQYTIGLVVVCTLILILLWLPDILKRG